MSQEAHEPSSFKGHTKNKSSLSPASRPRSSTRGPLDVNDNDSSISSPTPETHGLTAQLAQRPAAAAAAAAAPSPQPPHSTSQVGQQSRLKDFSFLLRPEIYHALTPLNVPAAFRNSSKQPDPTTPLDQLVARGHFRAAAIAAVQELTGSRGGSVSPTDSHRIFDLLYTRLVCLTLIDATPLAAQEVKALQDLSDARTYVDDETGHHLVPWDLRLVSVRLQALGFGDARRAVMSYHDLAREARQHAAAAERNHDTISRDLWKARLHELGIKVAGALIDMDDASGAAHHLATLRRDDDDGDKKLALSKALLWLHLGDVDRARECILGPSSQDGPAAAQDQLISALCEMADGNYDKALDMWRALGQGDEMVGVNTAVCLLYLGRMQEAKQVLEHLVNTGFSSHTLLFNLSTMYELCAEKSRTLKTRLAERVAAMDESTAGWEKMNADFKL